MSSPKAQTLTHRLAHLAKFQGIQYQFALTTFLLQQLLVKLTKHRIFKGGFVMLMVYKSRRYTIDLDASLEGI